MNVRLKKNLHFTMGVWHADQLVMNSYMVDLYLHTNTADSAEQNIAFERLKYFVYGELDSSIMLDQQAVPKCQQLMSAGLRITTMPHELVDQLVGIMLYYKLNAIMEQRIVITDVEISSNLGDHIVYMHNQDEHSQDLDRPAWWTTADLAHCDHDLIESSNIVNINRVRSWRELELDWPVVHATESGNIVSFSDLKRNDTE